MTPNAISVASVIFAALAGGCLLATTGASGLTDRVLFLAAAVFIQLRLICNLMDGMVAVEGGKGGPCGEVFNDFPDRIADVLTLVGAGYASAQGLGIVLGWICACGALLTAYVRVLGTALTGKTDFCGVMAKPQRMAVVTLAAVGQVFLAPPILMRVALVVIAVGVLLTTVQRLRRIMGRLNAGVENP